MSLIRAARLTCPSPLDLLIVAALATLLLTSLGVGAVAVSPSAVISIGLESAGLPGLTEVEPAHRSVVTLLRAPRCALGLVVGASLGLSGALVQGLFRNPLADPALLGISSGAALGAATAITLGASALGPAAGGFAGALGATLAAVTVARRNGSLPVATLLLAGIAITSLCGALTGLVMLVADDAALRGLTFWTLGSVGGATWSAVGLATAGALPLVLVALGSSHVLDALLLGEQEARALGVDVRRLTWAVVGAVALSVGASVAMSGVLGFVGLVVPHLCRLGGGPRHAGLLPRAALLGGAVVVGADLLARSAIAPVEIPLGIVTALLGTPFFLALLRRTP